MTRHSDETRLRNMLDHAREAVEMTAGKTRADLDLDRKLSLALVRLLEIVGEASARVSENVRTRHPEIPWAEMAGMRNRLIHGYDEVDYDILWRIVGDDLPALITRLETLLANN